MSKRAGKATKTNQSPHRNGSKSQEPKTGSLKRDIPKRSENKTESHDGPCPIMRMCGGCEWLGLPYRKQLARKHAAMVELFNPLIEQFGWNVAVEPVLGMETPLPSPRGFRHKAASPFAPGANGQVRSGFFAQGSHAIIPCASCAVEAPGARELLNEVAHLAESLGIPAYDEDRRTGQLRYAIVRTGWRTEETMLTLVTRSREVPQLQQLADALRTEHPHLVCVAHNINPRPTNAILGGETRILAGRPRMRDELLGCSFEISPTAFYQVNPQQTEMLYQTAIDSIPLQDGQTVLDAYCGSGTIGLCAADAAREAGVRLNLVGVERNKDGVRDAIRNAELNGLERNAEFIARDATEYMQDAAAGGMRIDSLIMDPPRAGSTPEFITAAGALAPRTIVYISCNPTTQARDLELFAQQGYRLTRLVPVDLFPHTTHTETVATLMRL